MDGPIYGRWFTIHYYQPVRQRNAKDAKGPHHPHPVEISGLFMGSKEIIHLNSQKVALQPAVDSIDDSVGMAKHKPPGYGVFEVGKIV